MHPKYSMIFWLLFVGMALTENSFADVGLSLSIKDEGKKSFYLAVGAHYKASPDRVVLLTKKGIPDEELPVVYHLAAQARVKPELLIDLRKKGKSWADITLHFGLGADIYYVPLKTAAGPPYGKAYGHFKNTPRHQWNRIMLSDRDIINFVNLKFISKRYGHSPDSVIKLRAKGGSFVSIHGTVKKNKQGVKKSGIKLKTLGKNKAAAPKGPIKSGKPSKNKGKK